jgi:hypothetical protein
MTNKYKICETCGRAIKSLGYARHRMMHIHPPIDWLKLTTSDNISDMQEFILDTYGRLSMEDYMDAMLIVQKFSDVWDRQVDSCSNGDRQYAPAVLTWYAKKKLNFSQEIPIKIVRAVYLDLKPKLNLR